MNRVDGPAIVTGRAAFAADADAPGVARAVVVESVATGRLLWVDPTEAESAPGVLAVITPYSDLAIRRPTASWEGGHAAERRGPLEDERVHYVGQAVALVVAETIEQAEHAARLVAAHYDAAGDEGGEPVVETDERRGEPGRALEGAEVRVERAYATPSQSHCALEPHATLASWQDGHLTVHDSTQGIFRTRAALAEAFGMPVDRVEVVCDHVGGGFGGKGLVWPHVILAALAAREVGRPVKLALSRRQAFSMVGSRPWTRQFVALGARRDGGLRAVLHTGVSATGPVTRFVEPFTTATPYLFAADHVRVSQSTVRRGIVGPAAMRGPGYAPGAFAYESALDELAWACGLDPVELRIRNEPARDPESGREWSSRSLVRALRVGAERFGWAGRAPRPRSRRVGGRWVGVGCATGSHATHWVDAEASVAMLADGRVVVEVGTQEIGTGTATAIVRLAAQALGVPEDRVVARIGRTGLPPAPHSSRSMTLASVGTAVDRAARELQARLCRLLGGAEGSPLRGVVAPGMATDEIRSAVSAAGGRLVSRREPSRGETYESAFARLGLDRLEERFRGGPSSIEGAGQRSHHAFSALFCEVGVDEALGRLAVRRFLGVYDVGRVVDPRGARAQMVGGVTMGIGAALMERLSEDEARRRAVNGDLSEYHVPLLSDVPEIEAVFLDGYDPHGNPLGAKGAGEIGIVGVAAAIANAVFHATGRRVRELPIGVDRLL